MGSRKFWKTIETYDNPHNFVTRQQQMVQFGVIRGFHARALLELAGSFVFVLGVSRNE